MKSVLITLSYSLIILFFFLTTSCTNDTGESEVERVKDSSMFEEIKKMYDQIDPTQIDYLFNEKRSAMMSEQMKQMDYPEKLNIQLFYIKELLRSNKLDEALSNVDEVNEVIERLKLNLPDEIKQKFLLLHASIYLRQGELQNCIENHQSSSCIIPFDALAIHKNKQGSEAAIPLLNQILAINPENYSAIWLLNLAYETLGKSKSDLISAHRINFDSKSKNAWPNKSGIYGIDFNGLAGGVAADDFNNDGLIDIIISSWGNGDALHYYENSVANGFVDKSKASGLSTVFGGLNINHTDYNNDGFLDVFVMRGGWFETQGKLPNSLLRNNGDGTFTDVTKDVGIYTLAPTQSSSWSDFNMDGFLDLFVTNESSKRASFENELWINQGNGNFVNQIDGSGLDVKGFFKGCTSVCLTKDSAKPDLFLSDYEGRNRIFKNESTKDKIVFVELASNWKVDNPVNSFSCWSYDHNNDGLEDIFVTGYGDVVGKISPIAAAGANYKGQYIGAAPIIYVNNGKGFEKLDQKQGLDKAAYTMGSNFGDLDNDGFLDFYLATGDPAISSIVPNLVYRNNGGKKLDDLSFDLGMAHLQKGHAVAFADFDRDGDQDIYNVLGGAYEGDVYQNAYFENPGNDNNWIVLKLQGTKSNRAAIGARVELVVKNQGGKLRSLHRKVTSGSSFGGNSLQLEIGLGDAVDVVSCKIVWPIENSIDEFQDLEVNSAYTLIENEQAQKQSYNPIKFAEKMNHKHHQH